MKRKLIAALTITALVCSMSTGCGAVGNKASEKQNTETETENSRMQEKEILGYKVKAGTVSQTEGIFYQNVVFEDYSFSVNLPTALWDPDNFANKQEDEIGEDSLDLPLTDWTTDDRFCVVVPSTAYFSITDTETDQDADSLKQMSDADFLAKKLEGYSNITALSDTVERKETEAGYQFAIKVEITLNLYDRDFTYEGYWISVYHDGKVLDFSYGEAPKEEGESYHTAEMVKESFEYQK